MKIQEIKIMADDSMEITVEMASGEEKVIHLNEDDAKVMFSDIVWRFMKEHI
jgi:hypothetical protein